ALAILIAFFAVNTFAQGGAALKQPVKELPLFAATSNAPLDFAKAAVTAHGGDKLKKMRSLVLRGTVDVTGAFSMVISATFMLVIAGDRYVFELNNPVQPLKQIFDGKQTYSSGYELPPVTSLGF